MIISGRKGLLGNHRSGFKVNGIKKAFLILFAYVYPMGNEVAGMKMGMNGVVGLFARLFARLFVPFIFKTAGGGMPAS